MLRNSLLTPICLILASLSAAPAAQADTILGNINTADNTLFWVTNYLVGGSGNKSVAEGFTMTQTVELSSVDLMLGSYIANGTGLQLSIRNDNGSGNPGSSILELLPNSALPTTALAASENYLPYKVNFSGAVNVTLVSGSTYWLDLHTSSANNPNNNDDQIRWLAAYDAFVNSVNPTGPYAIDIGQLRDANNMPAQGTPLLGPSEVRAAFQLNGVISAVPEPNSLMLVILAMLTLNFRRGNKSA